MNAALAARRDEAVGAFMLLTRLPVARFARRHPPQADCVWAYPLAGCAVGAIGAAVFWAASCLGLPPAIAAIWAVAATILATGGLHEDGLADAADGFGGGRTIARKLEIMRDSRIGGFGALALILALGLRVAALAALADPARAALALLTAGMAGRGAVLGVLLASRPARDDGLAAPLGAASPVRAWLGVGIAGIVALLPGAWIALPAAAAASAAIAWQARRQIGGYTGDVLGAAEQVAECLILTALLTRSA